MIVISLSCPVGVRHKLTHPTTSVQYKYEWVAHRENNVSVATMHVCCLATASYLTASTCAGFHNPHDLQVQMETDLADKTIKNTLACFEKMAANNAAPEGWLYGMKVKHNDAYGSYI